MNNAIRTVKAQALENLKQQKEQLMARSEQMIAEKFAFKMQEVDQQNRQLDGVYEKYRQEKLAAYNAELQEKGAEVAAKKSANVENAKVSARTEVEAQLASDIMEFDKEIAKLKKEIGDNDRVD